MSNELLNSQPVSAEPVSNPEQPQIMLSSSSLITDPSVPPVSAQPESVKPDPTSEVVADSVNYKEQYESLKFLAEKKLSELTAEELSHIESLKGISSSASDYSVPDGFAETDAEWFKSVAAELKLPKNTALELAAKFQDYSKNMNEYMAEQQRQISQQNIEALKKEFGSAFDTRISLANRAASAIGGEELISELANAGLGSNPAVIKALAKVGQMLSEDRTPESRMGTEFGMTPEEAKRKIEVMMADKEVRGAYYDRFNPKHNVYKTEITKLYEMAYPG